ncbi:ribose 5-phosphate isomerase B [Johnsonella ignava ATCC 51276]|jgi:ribose-5-phosphate isomerase B|uniref:Ribose 5-phosphate isomerase B n=1 Tax=Johnsonella ignava ATCC 51276 TaxID=679200 RepID=G5GIQ0_9FIRM|nr:ribose 5-phosphate isomerase B [Johnsonella ignava]EHI55304.1 ribose 5-phosphate isomerase B [Johnsonella ignava ATCC 51276]
MKIGFGNDHAGTQLKESLMKYLEEKGFETVDFGAAKGEKADYPVPATAVGEAVAGGLIDKGVLICGTGIGISISANKIPGIRAAVCSDPYSARMAVLHNNANIIALGARVVGDELAKMIVDEFFSAEFEGGRHERRVDMIKDLEKKYMK